MNKVTAQEQVFSSWGGAAPDWIKDLAAECDKTSQRDLATKIGKSPALINQVLKNKYPGRLDRVEKDVKRVLDNKPVICPIQGEIAPAVCMNNQKLPYDGSNHMRVALFRACRKCPHNSKNN